MRNLFFLIYSHNNDDVIGKLNDKEGFYEIEPSSDIW